MEKIKGFFKGVKREFGKISWPSRQDIIKQTIAVVVVSVLLGLMIAALDLGFTTLMDYLSAMAAG